MKRRRDTWRRRGVAATVSATAAAVLALGVAGCGDDDSSAAGESTAGETIRAASITTSPVTSGDWDPANYQAFTAMSEKYGFEDTTEDSVGYDEAESVLARLAQSNDLIVATSAGYGAAVLNVAPQHPDTFFVVFAYLDDTAGLPNVAGFSSDWNELGFIAGASACLSADGGKIGHVNSEPIPAFTHFAGGMQEAAEEYCEGGADDYLQTYIRSFTDVSKGKQAALQLMNQGATVLVPTCDNAGKGVVDAAVEKDGKLIMSYVDQASVAPENVVTSWRLDFDKQYDEIGRLFSEGELEPKIYEQNFANGGINTVLPLENVPDSVNSEVEEIVNGLTDGSITVEDRDLQP